MTETAIQAAVAAQTAAANQAAISEVKADLREATAVVREVALALRGVQHAAQANQKSLELIRDELSQAQIASLGTRLDVLTEDVRGALGRIQILEQGERDREREARQVAEGEARVARAGEEEATRALWIERAKLAAIGAAAGGGGAAILQLLGGGS